MVFRYSLLKSAMTLKRGFEITEDYHK